MYRILGSVDIYFTSAVHHTIQIQTSCFGLRSVEQVAMAVCNTFLEDLSCDQLIFHYTRYGHHQLWKLREDLTIDQLWMHFIWQVVETLHVFAFPLTRIGDSVHGH